MEVTLLLFMSVPETADYRLICDERRQDRDQLYYIRLYQIWHMSVQP